MLVGGLGLVECPDHNWEVGSIQSTVGQDLLQDWGRDRTVLNCARLGLMGAVPPGGRDTSGWGTSQQVWV